MKVKYQIKPFISDGCSMFPDGTLEKRNAWLKCCILHDIAYWQGGDAQEKKIADLELKQCVGDKNYSLISKIMYSGVQIGGSPKLSTSFRWGYGWVYIRNFEKLSNKELEYVKKLKPKIGENLLLYLEPKIKEEISKHTKELVY